MVTVREFIADSYSLINPSSPTQTLQGNDLSKALRILNQLLQSYASTGLMLTIAKTVSCAVINGQGFVVCGPSTYTPTPDITAGRLANLDSAWLLLDGVCYPLIDLSRTEFLESFRYEPLQGLPRMIISYPDTQVVKLQLYPAPSQGYELFIRGKFQMDELTSSDTMVTLPEYYYLYLQFALAKYIAAFKGRADAWTPLLEQMLKDQKDVMVASSEVNVEITGDRASMLNGAYRVKAGI